jgi:ribonuclease E
LREVENRLRDALKVDRARVQVGRISRFGLLEMSRQRLRPSLGESSQIVCPRCTGQGTIRGVESLSLSVLRVIEEEVMKDKTQRVIAHVPVDVGTYLLNEKRELLSQLETRHQISVMLIPTPALETPNFDVQRIRVDDAGSERHAASYDLKLTRDELSSASIHEEARPQAEIPAVRAVAPPAPVVVPAPAPILQPPSRESSKPGFIKRVIGSLFGADAGKAAAEPQQEQQPAQADPRPSRDRNNRRRNTRAPEERSAGNRPRRQPRPVRDQASRQPVEAVTAKEPPASSAPPVTAPAGEDGADDKPRRSSRRGRRGGRRRGTGNRTLDGAGSNPQEHDTGNSQRETPTTEQTPTERRDAPATGGPAPETRASPAAASIPATPARQEVAAAPAATGTDNDRKITTD